MGLWATIKWSKRIVFTMGPKYPTINAVQGGRYTLHTISKFEQYYYLVLIHLKSVHDEN